MDAKVLCTRIRNVLDLLTTNHIIHDDTLLLLFIDGIKINVSNKKEVSEWGLHDFVQKISKNVAEYDPSILAFSLQLAGVLGGHEDWFSDMVPNLHALISKITAIDSVKNDTSVQTALLTCLKSLVGHTQGAKLILSSFKELVWWNVSHPASGLFLRRAVKEFIVTLYQTTQCIHNDWATEFITLFLNSVIDELVKKADVIKDKGLDKTALGSASQHIDWLCSLLAKVVFRCPKATAAVTQNSPVMSTIAQLLCSPVVNQSTPVMDLLGAILSSSANLDSFMTDIVCTVSKNKETIKLQKIAVLCAKSSSSVLRSMGQDLVTEPVSYIVRCAGKQADDVQTRAKSQLSEVWDRTQVTSLLLVSSVNQMTRLHIVAPSNILCVLQLTTGEGLVTIGSNATKITAPVVNNKKLQLACVQYFITIIGQEELKPFIFSVFSTMANIVAASDIDAVLHRECLKCMLPWLPDIIADPSVVAMVTKLGHTLSCDLSALQWERRDTTLEFIGKAIQIHAGSDAVINWLVSSNLHVQIWHSLSDGESYVRASAITALYRVLQCSTLKSALLLHLDIAEVDTVLAVLSILETDTEAFGRRSAMTFVAEYLNEKNSKEENFDTVKSALCHAANDFDWEVKQTAFEVIETLINYRCACLAESDSKCKNNVLPLYAQGLISTDISVESNEVGLEKKVLDMFDKLCDDGVIEVLMKGLTDYEETVCDKAASICSQLQQTIITSITASVCEGKIANVIENSISSQSIIMHSLEDRFTENRKRKGASPDSIPTQTKKVKLVTSNQTSGVLSDHDETNPSNFRDNSTKSSWCIQDQVILTFCKQSKHEQDITAFFGLDLVEMMNQKSGDDKTVDLLGVIEDIMSSVKRDEGDEDNAIDCY